MSLLQTLCSLCTPTLTPEEFYTSCRDQIRTHHIHALIAREITEQDDVSAEVKDQAREYFSEARGRHALYVKGLERIIAILDKSGFPYALIKGAGLWPYYPEPWLREQDDIDIILNPVNAAQFLDLLASEDLPVASSDSHGAHLSLHFKEDGLPDLEVHTATGPAWKNSLSAEYVLKNTEKLSIGTLNCMVPNETTRLRLALQHAANHHILTRLQWLNEIALMLDAGIETDWMQELEGLEARSCGAVLHYAGLLTDSDTVSAAAFRVNTGGMFRGLLKRIIPEERVLDNPVCISKIRRHLFNMLLVQNPFMILKGFLS